jgi:LSD1 subclass zinc finger protein
MASVRVHCDRCHRPLDFPPSGAVQTIKCAECGAEMECWLFPAVSARLEDAVARSQPAQEGEATCFNHSARKATAVCEGCGRFMCALCEIGFMGAHYCPSCFQARRVQGRISRIQDSVIRYDRVAMALAVFPALCVWPALVAAPIALYVVVRHWNASGVAGGPIRKGMILAGVLALLEVVLIVVLALLLIGGIGMVKRGL